MLHAPKPHRSACARRQLCIFLFALTHAPFPHSLSYKVILCFRCGFGPFRFLSRSFLKRKRKIFRFPFRIFSLLLFCSSPEQSRAFLKQSGRNSAALKTLFHLYPETPKKLHINVQQSHICKKFYFFKGKLRKILANFLF